MMERTLEAIPRATRNSFPLGDGWFQISRRSSPLARSPHPFTPYASFLTHKPFLIYKEAQPTISPLFIKRSPSFSSSHHSSFSSSSSSFMMRPSGSKPISSTSKRPSAIPTFAYPSHLAGRLGPPPPLPSKPSTSRPVNLRPHHRNQTYSDPYKPLSPHALHNLLKTLPLPPDPNHPDWKGRCFDCLVVGHRPGACVGHMVCWNCRQSGHPAKTCPLNRPSTRGVNGGLLPRGNQGDALLPPNRPNKILTLIHETPNLTDEVQRLKQGAIIDARFLPGHTLHSVNYDLLQALNWSQDHHLASLTADKYLLLLPPSIPRIDFLAARHTYLENLGYVWYAWSPLTAASTLPLKFKAWLSLSNLPPYSWTVEHLAHITNSFGLLLDHDPLDNVSSFASLNILIAAPDLSLIPHCITVFVKGVAADVNIKVLSWTEETFHFEVPPDTTPPDKIFEDRAQQCLLGNIRRVPNSDPSPIFGLTIDPTYLKQLCDTAPPSEAKDFFLRLLQGVSDQSASQAAENPDSLLPLDTSSKEPNGPNNTSVRSASLLLPEVRVQGDTALVPSPQTNFQNSLARAANKTKRKLSLEPSSFSLEDPPRSWAQVVSVGTNSSGLAIPMKKSILGPPPKKSASRSPQHANHTQTGSKIKRVALVISQQASLPQPSSLAPPETAPPPPPTQGLPPLADLYPDSSRPQNPPPPQRHYTTRGRRPSTSRTTPTVHADSRPGRAPAPPPPHLQRRLDKGKAPMAHDAPPNDTNLRRSSRTSKQPALFSGLIPTPSKAKNKNKTKFTFTKAKKQPSCDDALASLRSESVKHKPLSEGQVRAIEAFCGILSPNQETVFPSTDPPAASPPGAAAGSSSATAANSPLEPGDDLRRLHFGSSSDEDLLDYDTDDA